MKAEECCLLDNDCAAKFALAPKSNSFVYLNLRLSQPSSIFLYLPYCGGRAHEGGLPWIDISIAQRGM